MMEDLISLDCSEKKQDTACMAEHSNDQDKSLNVKGVKLAWKKPRTHRVKAQEQKYMIKSTLSSLLLHLRPTIFHTSVFRWA